MSCAEETDSGKVELKALDARLHGWDVNPDDIQICTRADGSEWVLGAGTFGAVSCAPLLHHPTHSWPAAPTTLDFARRPQLWSADPGTLQMLGSGFIAPIYAHAQVYKALRDGVQDVAVKKLKVDASESGVQSFLEARLVSSVPALSRHVLTAPQATLQRHYDGFRLHALHSSVMRGAQPNRSDACVVRDVTGACRCAQECSILKSLNYDKNIVQFYGAVLRPGVEPMLVLEFMEV